VTSSSFCEAATLSLGFSLLKVVPAVESSLGASAPGFCFASWCSRRAFSFSVIPMCQPATTRGSQAPNLVGSRPAFTSTRTTYQTAAMPPPAARAAATSCSSSIRHFPAIRQLPGCCANHLVPMVKRSRTYLAGRSGGSHSDAIESPEKQSPLGPEKAPGVRSTQPIAAEQCQRLPEQVASSKRLRQVCRRFIVSKLLIMVSGLLQAQEPAASP